MDWVHGGPAGGADTGYGARALEVTGAHRRWPSRTCKMRRCRRVLTGAQVVVERRRDDDEERWRLELYVRAEECDKELRSEEERCGVLWGGAHPFIGVGGASWRWHRAVSAGGMALRPLMARAGLRGVLMAGES
jgi:hypothetical protein